MLAIHIVQTHTHTLIASTKPGNILRIAPLFPPRQWKGVCHQGVEFSAYRSFFQAAATTMLWCPTTRKKIRINTTQNFQCVHLTPCPRDSCVWAGGLSSRRHERGPVWRQKNSSSRYFVIMLCKKRKEHVMWWRMRAVKCIHGLFRTRLRTDDFDFLDFASVVWQSSGTGQIQCIS